ncbi:UDP-N-acetylmuramoyl-tripeptide--D-alanyl-D-alanine ligase [Sporotomaculum syntrophicum]|uniref:UDP-N-acetylmuramoyl-tripeptide--D-alanyl-D-alanine ligase n=1 Tax=Sporotomaculum syntrophicum TaxID=182264 RepID=A0A9D2WMP9_9FIRM|nr:UDP-N-acetylmuramoyl-tripeptide--D-alanyl-D-alanine ligase [Sporotomaculum syntrophicum]KAF1083825.1 UDP-N-acetylmuramoyl-tripeptide--D-alanyl-D-alanine ligase [Sporotomaculum syntrophicum]
MISITTGEICRIIQGKFVQGKPDLEISAAAEYKRHKVRTRRTLIFIHRKQTIDWDALKRVQPCAIVTDKEERELEGVREKVTVIRVEKIREAFWRFTNYYRGLFEIPVVAITGTCGKTTTREMIKHVLEKDYNVQSTIHNWNEPKRSFQYLQGIDHKTDAAVFETGLGNPGNLRYHCMIYQPTIGIITTIGVDHIEHCKTLEGYIQAKAELVEGLRPDGVLILNADDENIKKISLNGFKGKIVYFSLLNKAEFQAQNVKYAEGGMRCTLNINNFKYDMYIPGYGEHQVYNALAALAALHQMGIGMKQAVERLKSFRNVERHLEISAAFNGSLMIDDTWSTNPTSIRAALKVLEAIEPNKKKVLLIGDIQQLGDYDEQIHREIGSLIARTDIGTLITVGTSAAQMARQAAREQFKGKIVSFVDIDPVENKLKQLVDENTVFLIKSSRFNKQMMQLAEKLKKSTANNGA